MRRFIRRTKAIAHKELIHMMRDARVVYLALGLPVVMLAIFGYAVSLDIDHIPLAVADEDGTRASRRLSEALVAGGAFVRRADLSEPQDVEILFRRGEIKAALVIPKGYQRDLARGTIGTAQLLVDGSDGTVAAIAIGDAVRIVESVNLDTRLSIRERAWQGPPIRTRFNPAMRSSYNIVPGVIVMILGMVSTLLTALTVAREWERGNMEQLFATPVSRSQVIVGKLIPYAVLGFIQTLLILTLASYMFDIPIVGSLTLMFGCSMLFVLSMLGFGLYASVTTKTQLLAVQLAATLGYMPAMLLSGFLFPFDGMPRWAKWIGEAMPLTHYLRATRDILIRGRGPEAMLAELGPILAFALVASVAATLAYRRRLD